MRPWFNLAMSAAGGVTWGSGGSGLDRQNRQTEEEPQRPVNTTSSRKTARTSVLRPDRSEPLSRPGRARRQDASDRPESAKRPRRWSEPAWSSLSDEGILALRFCDLGVRIPGTQLEGRIDQLYDELERHGLRFRPHCWLSEEWFSPDGTPGIAIPFYLSHPRLMKLEYRQMLEVEGGGAESCMRLLRHETGHAIDSAYRLRRRRKWQELFGKPGRPYPDVYRPNPRSRNFVLHLDSWYAQSHPTEDFAETFAVWLKPGSGWRKSYQGWPALKKLEYVDDVMRKLAGTPPPVRDRSHIEPLSRNRATLWEHYRDKRARYRSDCVEMYDRELLRLFPPGTNGGPRRSAAAFLRRERANLRRVVAQGTGQHPYTIEQVLSDMIVRSRELGLQVPPPESLARLKVAVVLSVGTLNYILGSRPQVSL